MFYFCNFVFKLMFICFNTSSLWLKYDVSYYYCNYNISYNFIFHNFYIIYLFDKIKRYHIWYKMQIMISLGKSKSYRAKILKALWKYVAAGQPSIYIKKLNQIELFILVISWTFSRERWSALSRMNSWKF